jgi:outer membrane receptor protein involved in Fe transport
MPELRANAMFGWSRNAHSAYLAVRYIDGYKNDQFDDYMIDSWTAVDVRYNFEFEMITDQQTRLTIGARNIFDEDPSSLGQDQRPAYDDRVHDIRGQAAYVEIAHRF